MESESDEICTPEEIVDQANVATQGLLPAKSKEIYIKEYNTFFIVQMLIFKSIFNG